MELAFLTDTNEEVERFIIDTDAKADWAIRKIRKAREETDRLLALADEEIKRLNDQKKHLEEEFGRRTGLLNGMLYDYFNSLPDERKTETKTQRKYRLLSGDLVEKIRRIEFERDDEQLLAYLKRAGKPEYIKVTETPKWGEYKKTISVSGGFVVSADGEIVDGVMAVEKPAELEVVIR
jgi:hypothetical protein